MVLTLPKIFLPASMFDCYLELLPGAPHPIESRKRIRFHIGTAEMMGYVVLLGQERLRPGESAFVQIRLEEPTLALPGDRFIIRQYSPMITIGGGEILDGTGEKTSTNGPSGTGQTAHFERRWSGRANHDGCGELRHRPDQPEGRSLVLAALLPAESANASTGY
jgi:selenocysteine-specific translation elongation factor